MKPEVAIFDMDGTLCNVSGIRHYVRKPNRDFDSFHKASILCPPNENVVDAVWREYSLGRRIAIVSGRKEKYRDVTRTWLIKHQIPHDGLFMRENKDGRKDVEVKREILRDLRTYYEVVAAYDDNSSIIELWQSEGIDTVIVPGWETES